MAMADVNRDDSELGLFFEAMRRDAPAPSAALLARVIADAEAEARLRAAPPCPVPAGPGWLGRLVAGLGGWGVVAGLTAATLAGVWLGFFVSTEAPELLSMLASEESYELVELIPSLDAWLTEG